MSATGQADESPASEGVADGLQASAVPAATPPTYDPLDWHGGVSEETDGGSACPPIRSSEESPPSLLQALEPALAKYRSTKARRESQVLIRAVRLAPDLETCEAVLRGDRVPRSRLDAKWAKAYGL